MHHTDMSIADIAFPCQIAPANLWIQFPLLNKNVPRRALVDPPFTSRIISPPRSSWSGNTSLLLRIPWPAPSTAHSRRSRTCSWQTALPGRSPGCTPRWAVQEGARAIDNLKRVPCQREINVESISDFGLTVKLPDQRSRASQVPRYGDHAGTLQCDIASRDQPVEYGGHEQGGDGLDTDPGKDDDHGDQQLEDQDVEIPELVGNDPTADPAQQTGGVASDQDVWRGVSRPDLQSVLPAVDEEEEEPHREEEARGGHTGVRRVGEESPGHEQGFALLAW